MDLAASRVQRSYAAPIDPKGERSLFSHFWGIFRYLLSVAIGVAVVLALMNPKAPIPDSRPIPNASTILQQNILGTRGVPVTLSQPLINQALAQASKISWTPLFGVLPMPEWVNSSVILSNGGFTYLVIINLFSYPLYLSESFRLSGSSGQWNLIPEAASIGLLPLKGALLSLITPLIRSCSTPFSKELQVLKMAETLRIRSGYLDLIARP